MSDSQEKKIESYKAWVQSEFEVMFVHEENIKRKVKNKHLAAVFPEWPGGQRLEYVDEDSGTWTLLEPSTGSNDLKHPPTFRAIIDPAVTAGTISQVLERLTDLTNLVQGGKQLRISASTISVKVWTSMVMSMGVTEDLIPSGSQETNKIPYKWDRSKEDSEKNRKGCLAYLRKRFSQVVTVEATGRELAADQFIAGVYLSSKTDFVIYPQGTVGYSLESWPLATCLFELKKPGFDFHASQRQAFLELLSFGCHKPEHKAYVVLTDLNNAWLVVFFEKTKLVTWETNMNVVLKIVCGVGNATIAQRFRRRFSLKQFVASLRRNPLEKEDGEWQGGPLPPGEGQERGGGGRERGGGGRGGGGGGARDGDGERRSTRRKRKHSGTTDPNEDVADLASLVDCPELDEDDIQDLHHHKNDMRARMADLMIDYLDTYGPLAYYMVTPEDMQAFALKRETEMKATATLHATQ